MKPVVASVNWPWAVCLANPLAVRLINMEKKKKLRQLGRKEQHPLRPAPG